MSKNLLKSLHKTWQNVQLRARIQNSLHTFIWSESESKLEWVTIGADYAETDSFSIGTMLKLIVSA